MMKQNTILRAAVAVALAGGMASAYAAGVGVDGATTFSAVKVANELPAATAILLTDSAAQEFVIGNATTSFTPATGQSLQITVSLNNGAKFSSAPAVYCGSSATSHTQISANSGAAVLNLGGAGSSTAVFTLGTAQNSSIITRCFVSAADVSGTITHADVVETVTFAYGSLSSSTVTDTLITFESGLTATTTVGTDVTAQVTASFAKLAGGATLLSAGSIYWKGDTVAASTAADVDTKLMLGDVMGASSGSLTIAGDALKATTATTGAAWLISAGGVCGTTGAANGLVTAAGGVNSITFTGLTPTQVSAGLSVCVQFNGTTAIEASSITAKLGGTALSGYSLPTHTAATLVSVSRDGASTTVLNLPTGAAAASGTTGYLRVYNTSSSSGAFTATIYNDTGAAVATSCSLGTIAAGAAFAKSSAEIETLCSISSSPSGRYRVVINGAVSSLRAMATALSSTGVLVNLSGDSSTNNN